MDQISKVLFLDIETVSTHSSFEELTDRMKAIWKKKAQYFSEKEGWTIAETYEKKAAVFAEFGKVITIAIGYLKQEEGVDQFRVMCLSGVDEKELLEEFYNLLRKFPVDIKLCAHNGKEFDFPYLCRRSLVNGVAIPSILDVSGKKPWEVQHLDTLHMWKFGDYKHFTSLETLATIFDVPTSKDDIDGSEVGRVFYEEDDLNRIAHYCMKDVITLAQVYLKMKGLPLLSESQILML